MPNIPGSVPLGGFIAPTDPSDTYAVQDDTYNRGGYRAVASVAERDAIPPDRRKEGMLVGIGATGPYYALGVGLSNADWVDAAIGGLISVTHAELQALMAASTLAPGVSYLITDHVNIHSIPNSDPVELYSGPIEQLLARAVSTSEIDFAVSSLDYPRDIIHYEIDNDTIPGAFQEAYWEDGSDQGEPITISNVTANTFDINVELVIDSSFGMEAEDSGFLADYLAGDLGTNMFVTDLGGGLWRITLNGLVDLTDSVYNAVYIESNVSAGHRPGQIVYREDTFLRNDKSYDFRNTKFRRWKLDLAAIAYNPTTTYNKFDLVYKGSKLYVSIYGSNLGNDPTIAGGDWWAYVASDLENQYVAPKPDILQVMSKRLPVDAGSYQDFWPWSRLSTLDVVTQNTTAGAVIGNHQEEEPGTLDNNVHYGIGDSTTNSCRDVTMRRGSVNNTFISSINTVSLGAQSRDNVFLNNASVYEADLSGGIRECVMAELFQQIRTHAVVSRILFRKFWDMTVNGSMDSSFIGSLTLSVTGRFSGNMLIGTMRYCSIADLFSQNTIRNFFEYNTIGPQFYNNDIQMGFRRNVTATYIHDNLFASLSSVDYVDDNYFGPRFANNVINDTFLNNRIAADFDGNVILGGATFTNNPNIGPGFQNNTISGLFDKNSYIGQGFANNTIRQFYRNTVDSLFIYNDVDSISESHIGPSCNHNDITGSILASNLGYNFSNNTIPVSMRYNTSIASGVAGVDFTSATHAVNSYSCEFITDAAGLTKLRYTDAVGATQIVNPNA